MCFFKKKKAESVITESTQVKSKYDGFDIEFMPITKRYYPRYKEKYFYKEINSGTFKLDESISFCEFAKSQEEAKKIIDQYLELHGIGSEIIKLT